MNVLNIVFRLLLALVVFPIIGGLIVGLDRKLTARLQGRYGPPILQPFYDVLKLFSKQRIIVNEFQVISVFIYLASSVLSLVLFTFQSDLLMIIFVMSIGAVFLVVGALSVKSAYSQVGAQRELMQMLSYEPLLILIIVGMYLMRGSFNIAVIMSQGRPLIEELPLLFLVMVIVLGIKMRKSPFDLSASEHAHQELVRGLLTDYSGLYLGLIDIAHWFDLMLLLGISTLFFYPHIVLGIIASLFLVILEIVIDNVTARLTVKWMLTYSYGLGLVLAAINIAVVYILR
ncbi:respiratory chain complex I subunit 1 family protein [Coprothermobacter platensis]|uniref:respiratory chain complex I subunit 1 family protein n=1 Tax=Coprothermobacter platensis TaxID=108819 RepID=UPI00036B3013|nr:complex I subunit 1 family protein [Coprothermobacter platensis]